MKLKNCIEGRFVRVKKSAEKHVYIMDGRRVFGPDWDCKMWEDRQGNSLGAIGIVRHIKDGNLIGVYFPSLGTWYYFLPEMLKRGK